MEALETSIAGIYGDRKRPEFYWEPWCVNYPRLLLGKALMSPQEHSWRESNVTSYFPFLQAHGECFSERARNSMVIDSPAHNAY